MLRLGVGGASDLRLKKRGVAAGGAVTARIDDDNGRRGVERPHAAREIREGTACGRVGCSRELQENCSRGGEKSQNLVRRFKGCRYTGKPEFCQFRRQRRVRRTIAIVDYDNAI